MTTAVRVWLLAVVLGFGGFSVQAGAIGGKISDAQGGVLPGVTVNAKSDGRTWTTVTNHKGEYRFDRLLPGRYRIDAELAGFTPVTADTVVVEVDRTVTWNAVLQVIRRGIRDPAGDFLGRITKAVGVGAVVCGQHRLNRSAPSVPIGEIQKSLACGLDAAVQRKAFWMSYELKGIEGVIVQGVAGTADGTILRFFYDSDTGAGDPGFSTELCARPTLVERDGHVQVRCRTNSLKRQSVIRKP